MNNKFYKDSAILLEGAITNINAKLNIIRKYKLNTVQREPIEYITTRIKSEESVKEKLKRKGYKVNLENALTKLYDLAGIRIICSYIDDVYEVVEIQIRTIAMDFWSNLEHQMKYKKNIKNYEFIGQELKRCADEIATIDINMRTIRDMINSEVN